MLRLLYSAEFRMSPEGSSGAIGAKRWLADWLGYKGVASIHNSLAADTPGGRTVRLLVQSLHENQRLRLSERDRMVPEDGPRSGFAKFARGV